MRKVPPALGPRVGKMEYTFGSCGKGIGRDRHQARDREAWEPEAEKKILGWGAQEGETRWAGRSHQRGWPISS